MGIIREIHSAYGVTLKGEYQEYHWYDGRVDDVIWTIYVNDREIYLGNGHFIISEDKTNQLINMEADKDLLCYYLSKENYDLYNLERFFEKEYTGCWWRHKARQQQMRERQEEENRKEIAKREATRQRQLDELHKYADKKKFYMIVQYDQIYFIKYDKRKYKAEDLAHVGDNVILQFAQEHPGNGVDIAEQREFAI